MDGESTDRKTRDENPIYGITPGKTPPGSSSPTSNPTPPWPPPNRVPRCHIQVFLEHSQGWGLKFPGLGLVLSRQQGGIALLLKPIPRDTTKRDKRPLGFARGVTALNCTRERQAGAPEVFPDWEFKEFKASPAPGSGNLRHSSSGGGFTLNSQFSLFPRVEKTLRKQLSGSITQVN